MKFTQKLNLLVEGIGANRNLYLKLPNFRIKDDNFLGIIDNLFILKKFISYLNDEIEEFNKKSSYKKKKFYVEIDYPDQFSEMFNNYLEDKINIDQFKKQFINKILEEYSDEIKIKNNLKDISIVNQFTYDVFTLDERYINSGTLKPFSFNLQGLIHDLLGHFVVSEKDIYKFRFDAGNDGYDFQYPFKYSPESILNELFATQTDSFIEYNTSINLMLKKLYSSYNKHKDQLSPTSFFKNFKTNKKLLDGLIKFLTIGDKYELDKKYNFSFKDLEDLKIFLKKNYNHNSFLSLIKDIENIIKRKNIIVKSYYPFIQNVIASINYRKEKFKINPDSEQVTWEDFRLFFKNYPNVLKLFPQNKYPSDLIIYETPEEGGDEYGDYAPFIETDDPIITGINNKMVDAVNSGQSLMKKTVPRKSDFQNPQSIIDFILEKISNLIRNNLNDNSKYYKILEDKLKNK